MSAAPSRAAIAWTAAIGLFMAVLDGSVVNVALPAIGPALHADLSTTQWVITGYLLIVAAAIPLAGVLGQRFGLKRVFMAAQLLFVLGSLACGLASSLPLLILARLVQGLGGGALFPLAQSLALQAYPPAERASASAITGLAALVAPALGPTLGGWLTDTLGWQAIFLINLPVCLVALTLTWRLIPNDQPGVARLASFDALGLALCIAGVLALISGLTLITATAPGSVTAALPRGAIYGWAAWPVRALLAGGAALLALCAWYELRVARAPALALRLFARPGFTLPSLASGLVTMVIFGSLFLLPVFLETVRQPALTPTTVGLVLLPQGLAAAVGVTLSGRWLYNRLGARTLVVTGGLLLAVGTLGLTQLRADEPVAALLPWLVLRGLGLGWAFIPTQTRALQDLTGAALAQGSVLLNVLRQICGALGTAAVNTLFLQRTALHIQSRSSTALAGTQATNEVFTLVLLGSLAVAAVALTLPPNPVAQPLGPAEAGSSLA